MYIIQCPLRSYKISHSVLCVSTPSNHMRRTWPVQTAFRISAVSEQHPHHLGIVPGMLKMLGSPGWSNPLHGNTYVELSWTEACKLLSESIYQIHSLCNDFQRQQLTFLDTIICAVPLFNASFRLKSFKYFGSFFLFLNRCFIIPILI